MDADRTLDRYPAYRKAWQNAAIETPPIPLNIDLELSASCNLACSFCYHANPEWVKPNPRIMPIQCAKEVIDEASELGVPAIKFNYRGEPTLHPEFESIVCYAQRKNFADLLLNTNANWPDVMRGPLWNGLQYITHLMVSLDSCRQYESIRLGGTWGRVSNNIRDLIQRGHPNLVIRRVITDINKHENFAEDCQVEFGTKGYTIAETAVFNRATVGGEGNNVERLYCADPSRRLVLTADGKWLACCADWRGKLPLGTYPHDSIMDVWEGKLMNGLRMDLKAGRIPGHCIDCESWRAYKHPNCKKLEEAIGG